MVIFVWGKNMTDEMDMQCIAELARGDYLCIRLANGARAHGGDQNWWLKKRISRLGCGVIAMNDLECYLSGKKHKDASERGLTKEAYEEMVSENWRKCYHIGSAPWDYAVGLFPHQMEKGLTNFLTQNDFPQRRVKWAPYCLQRKKMQKESVRKTIREMLEKDLPVVCSYHTFDRRTGKLTLYRELERAIKKSEPARQDAYVSSHYMTIIGLYEDAKGAFYLKLVSWGRIYYVRYEEYVGKLSYFTNILRIF